MTAPTYTLSLPSTFVTHTVGTLTAYASAATYLSGQSAVWTGPADLAGGSIVVLYYSGAAFTTDMIGCGITITGATTATNNGNFIIAAVPTATKVCYINTANITQAADSATATYAITAAKINQAFELSVLIDCTSATYGVQVLGLEPLAPKNFACAAQTVLPNQAGVGVTTVVENYAKSPPNAHPAELGSAATVVTETVTLPTPTTVAAGATQYYYMTWKCISKSQVPTAYTLGAMLSLINVSDGSSLHIGPTTLATVSVAF